MVPLQNGTSTEQSPYRTRMVRLQKPEWYLGRRKLAPLWKLELASSLITNEFGVWKPCEGT